MEFLQRLFPSTIPIPEPVPPLSLPLLWYEQTTTMLLSVNSIQQIGIAVFVLLLSCLLLYLLFDKLVRLFKFVFYWGFFSYGVINFFRIEWVKTISLWLINKL